MRLLAAVFALLAAGSAQAQDDFVFTCDGVFAADTSEVRLAEAFGADNVSFLEIVGDEGTYPMATVLFPENPEKRLSIVWQDETGRQTPHYILFPDQSAWTVGGLRTGMSIDDVEALNGGSFNLGGFNDIDRGRVADWGGGNLDPSTPSCTVDVNFGYRDGGTPTGLDYELESEGPYSSEHPAFHAVGARITLLTISYPQVE